MGNLLQALLVFHWKSSLENGEPYEACSQRGSGFPRFILAWREKYNAESVLGSPVALLMECEWGISSGRGWLTQSVSSVTILARVETEYFLGKTENHVLKE